MQEVLSCVQTLDKKLKRGGKVESAQLSHYSYSRVDRNQEPNFSKIILFLSLKAHVFEINNIDKALKLLAQCISQWRLNLLLKLCIASCDLL